MSDRDKAASTARLLEQLQRSQAFHVDGAVGVERELGILQSWQSARLARTYADLLASPRYRPAAEFFLDELYGNRNLRQREHDLARIVPVMTRVLPANVLHTAALGLELNALSRELDARLTRMLIAEFAFHDQLDESAYVAAYRRCASYDLRQHQIDLVERLGRDLRSIVPKRFIHAALKLAKKPAQLAGLGALHQFLESGFRAFRHMGADAGTFVATIVDRESAILQQIRAGHPRPLELAVVTPSPWPSLNRHAYAKLDETPNISSK